MGIPIVRKWTDAKILTYATEDLIHHITVLCCPTMTWSFATFNKLFYFPNSYWLLTLYSQHSFPFIRSLTLCLSSFSRWLFSTLPKRTRPKVILPLSQQIIPPTPSHFVSVSSEKIFCSHCLAKVLSPFSHLWFHPFQGTLSFWQHAQAPTSLKQTIQKQSMPFIWVCSHVPLKSV